MEEGCHSSVNSDSGFSSSCKEQENAELESNTEFSSNDLEEEEDFFYSHLKLEDIRKMHQTREFYELPDEDLLDWCEVGSLEDEEERESVMAELDAFRKYLKQVEESEGFDIDVYPKIALGNGLTDIGQSACSRELYPELYEKYVKLADLAIKTFNMENYGVEYEVLQVERANMTTSVFVYYITFTAYDVKASGLDTTTASRTFQAIVAVDGSDEDGENKVYFCRLKGATV